MELVVLGNARAVVIVTFFAYTAAMLLIGYTAKKIWIKFRLINILKNSILAEEAWDLLWSQ